MTNRNDAAKAAILFVAVSASAMSLGCAANGHLTAQAAQPEDGVIEICETRGTDTRCHFESAAVFAEEIEAHREMAELQEIERSDDW